jgi:hypothetical protein
MKRIALAVILGSACMAASAMEQLPDDTLSDAVGQSGLSIDVSPVTISAQHVRYHDGDGFSGFTGGASVDVGNLTITTVTDTLIRFDVASNGTGSGAQTALFLYISPTLGMSITTGDISTDSGDELTTGPNVHKFAQFSATNINISAVDLVVTAGGHFSNSGLTVSTLLPVSASADLALKDTVAGGVLSTHMTLTDFMMRSGTVDVLQQDQGVEFGAGTSSIDTLSFGDVHAGPSAFTGTDMGSVALRNLNLTGSTVSVVGH